MEHHSHSAQTQVWRQYLTSIPLFSQKDQAQAQMLSFQQSVEVPNGQKRRGRIPSQSPEEKRFKKIEADRRFRQNHKAEFDRLRAMASKFGGVENMDYMINQMQAEQQRLRDMLQQKETEFERVEEMKHKFGGIEEMESKLLRLKQIESMFQLQGNGDGIVSEIERLKSIEIELQHIKSTRTESHFYQQQDYDGMQSVNLNNRVQGSEVDLLEDHEISDKLRGAKRRTMPELMYSDARVTELAAKLNENILSGMCLCGINDLHQECQIVGEYTSPSPLFSSVSDIFNDHRNALLNCGLSADSLESISVSFCDGFNEMHNLSLSQIDEDFILKLRDKIENAILIDCSLKFALDYLKKIAYVYFGLKAQNDLSIVDKRLADLMAEEKSLRVELDNKINEVKAMNAKKEQYLTSPLCRNCLDCADDFLHRNIGRC